MMSSNADAVTTTRSLKVDDTVVLKLAIGGSLSKVAVSTFAGLYNVDFSGAGNPGIASLPHFYSQTWITAILYKV